MPTGVRLHGDPLADGDAVKDWFATVALVVLFLVAGIEAIFIKHNADVVDALNAQNQALQISQAQQAAQFRIFLKAFTAESNYECAIDEYLAHLYNLPLPPSGTCTVKAP